ncbi:hypothetical protein ACTMU2_13390 [Cupriavidus basilensis]
MFLIRTIAGRGMRAKLAQTVRLASDGAAGIATIRDALPPTMNAIATDADLDLLRARLASGASLSDRRAP